MAEERNKKGDERGEERKKNGREWKADAQGERASTGNKNEMKKIVR